MAVSELGWSTLAEATSYFTNERLETDAWDDLATNDIKNKVLNMAYNRIHYCPDYDTPAKGDETAVEKIKLIKVQCEMAYYLAVHLADEDRRKGLQAQGVEHAGIVKEIYSEDKLNNLPMPPIVEAMLEEWAVDPGHAGILDLARDEEESVKTKVHDF